MVVSVIEWLSNQSVSMLQIRNIITWYIFFSFIVYGLFQMQVLIIHKNINQSVTSYLYSPEILRSWPHPQILTTWLPLNMAAWLDFRRICRNIYHLVIGRSSQMLLKLCWNLDCKYVIWVASTIIRHAQQDYNIHCK